MPEGPKISKGSEAPPIYHDDMAWTNDRHDRATQIYRALNEDRGDASAIKQLRDLVVECDNAVRAHAEKVGGGEVAIHSRLLRELLYAFFEFTKDKF